MSQANLLQSNVFAQQSASDTANIKIKSKDLLKEEHSQNEMLLDYIQSIQKAESEHRTYISWLYTILGSIILVLISALSITIAFFNKRSRREIKDSVDDTFAKEIKKQFKNKINTLEDSVSMYSEMYNSIINDSHRYFKSMSRALLVTSDIGNEENPFDERKLSGKEILWVDDKQYNIADYKLLLKNLGVIVTPAETTADTVKHLDSKHFDLIISNMGRENDGGEKAGLDLLEKIRSVQTPKIIFTRPDKRDQYKQDVKDRGGHKVVSGFLGILKEIVDILARQR